jgi:hypothetical protein
MRYAIFMKCGMVRKWVIIGVRGTVEDAMILAQNCLGRNIGKNAYVDVRIEKQEDE